MATRPRRILAGVTYLVTRRCTQRQFLLRPCETTSAIFLYVLAVAARRHGVLVHAFCVMSNHYHLVLTDPRGQLPAFGQYLDSLVARAINCSLGRWENFWDTASYSAVALVTPQDVIDKVSYVLANPVAAGLVPQGRDWPGLWSGTGRIGGEAFEVTRPKAFFCEKGPMPKSATLQLTHPPCFATTADFVAPVNEALARAEGEAWDALQAAGKGFLGVARILRQRPTARPAPGEPRRVLDPRVACRDKWRRVQALQRLGAFVAEYREALQAWQAGIRDALFPAGTWLMRLNHAVRCADGA